jgi:hypothetical protein
MKNLILWDVTPCGCCKNRRFGRSHLFIIGGDKNRRAKNKQTRCEEISSQRASVAIYGYVPGSPILVTLIMEALSSSEMSVLIRATRRVITEDDILHSRRRENLKSSIT